MAKSDKSCGTIYIMGKQVWVQWHKDVLGRPMDRQETWTAPTEEEALENYKDMLERWTE